MKLYITPTSPFVRMVRIVVHEKGLTDQVEEVEVKTRTLDSPYYAINPSGRVPYLVCEDGVGLEESQLICHYLDHLDGNPKFDHPAGDAGWDSRRLEALARSLLDGQSVWARELHRAADERSLTVIEHERQRSLRLATVWEGEIGHAQMNGDLNMAQITLITALLQEHRNPDINWRSGHPKLVAWADRIIERSSIQGTL